MTLDGLRTAYLALVDEEVARSAETAALARQRRLAEAQRQAAELALGARLDGEEDADAEVARIRADAARRARQLALRAQRELHDELRTQARAAAQALRSSPGYPALLDRLAHAAREQLGETAVLEIDPVEVGGVRAQSGSRLVDYSLPALVERCIARLGDRIEELWR